MGSRTKVMILYDIMLNPIKNGCLELSHLIRLKTLPLGNYGLGVG